ncbi:MAG: hypothetical protein H6738_14250 [Alphaproteobacteria bacterium]|nr:hypothetical protein [Alphaproteobacteria bacterium]MCB9697936.1 hypothetical protein [Alphaproteobacteria bacterium]
MPSPYLSGLVRTSLVALLCCPVAALAQDCPEPVSPAKVASSLDDALVNFAVMDQDAFEKATDEAIATLGCVDQVVSPELAAALHRSRGIRLMVSGDDENARLALEASARLVPEHELSTTIAPEGGRVAVAWEAARRAAPVERLPTPADLDLRIDGTKASDRPATGPYVLQVVGTEGLLATRYVTAGWPDLGLAPSAAPEPQVAPAPAPEPAVAELPMPAPEPVPMPAPEPVHQSKALLWAGVASGGVAAGLYGTAAITRLSYDDNPTPGGRSLTNGTYVASIGTAVLSGVLITTFFATR